MFFQFGKVFVISENQIGNDLVCNVLWAARVTNVLKTINEDEVRILFEDSTATAHCDTAELQAKR